MSQDAQNRRTEDQIQFDSTMAQDTRIDIAIHITRSNQLTKRGATCILEQARNALSNAQVTKPLVYLLSSTRTGSAP
jgi:hypothetical protein